MERVYIFKDRDTAGRQAKRGRKVAIELIRQCTRLLRAEFSIIVGEEEVIPIRPERNRPRKI